jgi:hypothetical protein
LADFGNGWVEIFRTGSYGDKGTFSQEDLDRVIANYDPEGSEGHEAPACVGHPKDNLPAYGWASRLMRNGNTLLAKFKEVDPAFEAAVKAGRYKKRSAAFYLDDKGRITNLRHVAFLGAQPPEVKGLKNLNFDDGDRRFTAVDFGEEETVDDKKPVKDQIKEFFAEMFGAPAQPKTFSEDDVKRIAAEAVTAATKPLQDQVSALQTDLTAQTAKFSERESRAALTETQQRALDAINGLKSKGRWVPAFDKAGLPLVFDELAKVTTTIEFGEAGQDGKKPQVAPLQVFTSFMESLPKIVPSGAVFSGASQAPTSVNPKDDPLTAAARARQKEKNITFSEALDQVVTERPELVNAGSAAAGAV